MKTHPPSLPVRTAIAGIGGFGAAHQDVHETLEKRGLSRVIATCDPALDRLGEICDRHHFTDRGVKTYKDFDTMLSAHAGEIDLGVIAAPIQCHASMHKAFVRNQTACYLEKPPTLDPDELEQMLIVEKDAAVATHVGFSHIFVKERLALKQRMLDGEFGALKRLSFLGLTSRSHTYFQRNNWAGRLLLNGNLLLDSCLGNAMSHALNSLLFFGNQTSLQEWARPSTMACELYRANPIEGTDTIFAIGRLDNNVEVRIAASHACPRSMERSEERMEFEDAVITIRSATDVTIERPGQASDTLTFPQQSLLNSVETYFEFLQGKASRPAQRLQDCRGFVETNALFYLAAGQIHDLPANAVSHPTPDAPVALIDVEEAGRRVIDEAVLPSQAGYSWASQGGSGRIETLPELRDTIETMTEVPASGTAE